MKKILVMALALGLFPAMAMAKSLEERQLQKINAKQALKFPQSCNIEDKVIAAAKKVYEANPQNFEAVYNYAVTLSAGDCDDVEMGVISPQQAKDAERLFKKALELKPTSPSSFAGLGYLTMYNAGLTSAYFFDGTTDDPVFFRAVKAQQKAAEKALSYYKSALQNGYTSTTFLEVLKGQKQALEEALNKIKSNKTQRAVQGRVAKRK